MVRVALEEEMLEEAHILQTKQRDLMLRLLCMQKVRTAR